MTLRDFKLSLCHEIKTVMLPGFGYIEHIEGESLGSASTAFQFANDDIAYASPSGRIDPSGVAIYDAGRRLELDEYEVDYIGSSVTLTAAPSGAVTADYSYYTIAVFDAFPTAEVFEATDLPMISIDFAEQSESPFAIGQDASIWKMDWFVDCFCLNDGMRLDLTDRLQRSFKKWIPILEFSEMPLNYDGTINTNFDWEAQFSHWEKFREKTKSTMINSGSSFDKEKYRSVIRGSLKSVH